ncbi:sigma-70 family RNA polymerase sigma factor [Frigidibacter sp. RF13]|uniref:RNA polymerase sigma factor n=1 Tax=Frigidibacter sp. RF13 TaxID=2997340 RepID=UPI00226F381E|nr:sigma-70 family RNA polymerase sigma factor [Frigidibacter sp. RF13]MCY1125561.1 sigma-70 family RNA polymerase sigma factor [Frigidibacter sp. RF13]
MTEAGKERLRDALDLAAWRGGDVAAFGDLVRRRSPRLYAHARRLSDDAESARDTLQEAWAEIWRGLPGLRDDLAFLPWAYAITTRAAARAVRRRQAGRALSADLAVLAPRTAAPDQAEAAHVSGVLICLPAPDRALLALAVLDGLSLGELAQALHIPVGTVKSRLHAARARLRALLDGEKDDQGS